MKHGPELLGVAVAAVFTHVSAAVTEPRLPTWNEGERARLQAEGWVAGSTLLTDEPVPNDVKEPEKKLIDVAQPTAEEMAETETPTDAIPEKYWTTYFDQKPSSFLVDPQGLLSTEEYRDRLSFLNYHAGDSSIDLYVYVFKSDQDIPGEVREEELMERFFSKGRPAAVVYYYLGAPQRSVLYLSPSLTDAVPHAEQRRALESSVMQAFKDVQPVGQMQSFLVQMSIRIYWMERMLHGGNPNDGIAAKGAQVISKNTAKKSRVLEKMTSLLADARPFLMPGAAALGLSAIAMGLSAWLKRRRRYYFPDFEVEPRLGGAHAAGVGAVISFASASVPPASQRDQVPDYLRRA